jgi:putative hemolysin
MSTLFWVLGISLSISFLCSILEAVLLSITHGHVAVMKENGEPAGAVLEKMQAKIDEPIAAILTLNTIAHTMGAAMGGSLAHTVFGEAWVTIFSAALTFVILIATEIVPKTVGATFWKQLASPTAHTLRWLVFVMKPILVPLSLFSRAIAGSHDQPTVSRTELEVLAEIGRREGTLDEDEWQVVTNVIRLDEVTLGEVMTPRTDMTAVPLSSTLAEAQAVMLKEGHLRVPVYQETVDNVVGILLARDLWKAQLEGVENIDASSHPPPRRWRT